MITILTVANICNINYSYKHLIIVNSVIVDLNLKIMKKLKLSLVLLLSVFTILSCSDQDEPNISNEVNLSKTINKEIIVIDNNELPVLSDIQSRELGYISLNNDSKKKGILDIKSNVLKVPFNIKSSIKSESQKGVGICIRVTIARQSSSNNCQGGCVDCLGFRCEIITFPCIIQQNPIVGSGFNRNPSQEREQTAQVVVDEINGVIEYYFDNEIDWEYLANN